MGCRRYIMVINLSNKFLDCAVCAVAGKADYIVSGDRHLLELNEYEGVKIVTALELLEVLSK